MHDLSIKHTLTGIGQTGRELARYALLGIPTQDKVLFGFSSLNIFATTTSVLAHHNKLGLGAAIGGGFLSSTILGGALLGSTVLGIYGAKEGCLGISAIGGALVGMTATGCTILAAPILGGTPLGLTSPAALLGLGGAGGALLGIATSLSAKSGVSDKYLIGRISPKITGSLLKLAPLQIMVLQSDPVISAVNIGCATALVSSLILGIIQYGSSGAIELDRILSNTNTPHFTQMHEFEELLQFKNILLPINLSSESIAYSKLLHKAIDQKVPSTWFQSLLKQPGIDLNLLNDQGETPANSIFQKFCHSGSQEQMSQEQISQEKTLYLEYLKYLLSDPRVDLTIEGNNKDVILNQLFENQVIRDVLSEHQRLNELQEKQLAINEIIDAINEGLSSSKTKSARTSEVENKLNLPIAETYASTDTFCVVETLGDDLTNDDCSSL